MGKEAKTDRSRRLRPRISIFHKLYVCRCLECGLCGSWLASDGVRSNNISGPAGLIAGKPAPTGSVSASRKVAAGCRVESRGR